MHPTRSSGAGSGISDTYTPEAAETLRFEEEIQSLMRDNVIQHGLESPPPVSGSSFTALLGLPPSQAVELLDEVEPRNPPAGRGEMWRNSYPRGPSFVELATRFSVFAVEDPAQSNSGERSPAKPKAEPEDYGDAVICPIPGQSPPRPGKRKDGDRSKGKGGSAKRSRSAEEDTGGEKLPYVHVRARRGQATDSHSLAERARREKINARMKLLQELVPGCSKITGTALVLDEIINHVQSLQRQVEFLSMRLAAVTPTPRIDFCGLDNFLLAECGRVAVGSGPPVVWSSDGGRQQQVWHGDTMQQGAPAVCWERGDNGTITAPNGHGLINPSLFVYDSHASVSPPNQSKTEF